MLSSQIASHLNKAPIRFNPCLCLSVLAVTGSPDTSFSGFSSKAVVSEPRGWLPKLMELTAKMKMTDTQGQEEVRHSKQETVTSG